MAHGGGSAAPGTGICHNPCGQKRHDHGALRLDAVQAFELLKPLSQRSNIKLVKVAQGLIDAEFPRTNNTTDAPHGRSAASTPRRPAGRGEKLFIDRRHAEPHARRTQSQ